MPGVYIQMVVLSQQPSLGHGISTNLCAQLIRKANLQHTHTHTHTHTQSGLPLPETLTPHSHFSISISSIYPSVIMPGSLIIIIVSLQISLSIYCVYAHMNSVCINDIEPDALNNRPNGWVILHKRVVAGQHISCRLECSWCWVKESPIYGSLCQASPGVLAF